MPNRESGPDILRCFPSRFINWHNPKNNNPPGVLMKDTRGSFYSAYWEGVTSMGFRRALFTDSIMT